jgi:hypothetical protein
MNVLRCCVFVGAVCACVIGLPAQAAGSNLKVTVNEWKVSPSSDSVAAGPLTLNISNSGKEVHEVLVLKLRTSTSPNRLPTAKDGSLDEDNLGKIGDKVGEVEDIQPGTNKTLQVSLSPGRYAIVCNRVDKEDDGSTEAYYMKGMSVALNVK